MLSMKDPSAICENCDIPKTVPNTELADLDAFHLALELSAADNEHAFTTVASNQDTLSWLADFAACIVHDCR